MFPTPQEGVSILSMACSKGLVNIAKMMIEKRAEIHSLDIVSYNYIIIIMDTLI